MAQYPRYYACENDFDWRISLIIPEAYIDIHNLFIHFLKME